MFNVAFLIIALPLLGSEAAKRREHPPALDREESDESPVEQGELEKRELDLIAAKAEASIAQSERDEYKWQVQDKEKELSQLRDEFLKFKRDHGRWRIKACGREAGKSLNLSVAILYIDHRDSNFAEQIYAPFSPEIPLTPWVKTQRKRNILDFDNPSSYARVVIFSDHSHANGIKAAFNGCDLLGERVDRFDKSFADGNIPDVDIAIVVFPSVGKQE